MRLLRADHLAGEHELHGDPFAHEPRQALRAAVAGNNPQLHFGLAELGGFAGQAQGAGHSNLTSAAERESIDAGDHRLAQVLDQVEHALPAVRVLLARDRVVLRQLANVRSSNKCLLARPGQDDYADIGMGITLNGMKRRPQLFHGRHIQCIEHLRPVHSDISNRVFLFDEDVGEGHKLFSKYPATNLAQSDHDTKRKEKKDDDTANPEYLILQRAYSLRWQRGY